jgi:hypothetical protein
VTGLHLPGFDTLFCREIRSVIPQIAKNHCRTTSASALNCFLYRRYRLCAQGNPGIALGNILFLGSSLAKPDAKKNQQKSQVPRPEVEAKCGGAKKWRRSTPMPGP